MNVLARWEECVVVAGPAGGVDREALAAELGGEPSGWRAVFDADFELPGIQIFARSPRARMPN